MQVIGGLLVCLSLRELHVECFYSTYKPERPAS